MVSSGFAALDELGGGFADGQSYLIHGPLGTAKTTFALQFLLTGLRAEESVALVTRRAAPVVLEKAHAFGFDLKPFVRNGQLALIEYAPRVVESCARLRDEREIVDELRAALGISHKRLVIDPVAPLLAGTSAASAGFRARGLTQGFEQLGATTLLLCDTPGDVDAVAAFHDLVYGSVRFEATPDGSPGRIVPEQLPGGRLVAVDFAVEGGIGLAPASPRGSLSAAARTLMLIVRDPEERARLAELLGKAHRVELADDAAEGLARMSASAPDLVLIDKEAGSVDGAEFCRKLRASGINVPIILLAGQLRRVRDRVALLAAGADDCLERPVDPRLLKLKVRALLSRYDGKRDRLVSPRTSNGGPPTERGAVTSARDLLAFTTRVEREIEAARESGLPFALVAVRPGPGGDVRAVGSLIERLVREYDFVWLGDGIALVLLAETNETGVRVFLGRLADSGASGQTRVHHCCLDPARANGASLLSWIEERVEAADGPALQQALHA